MTTSKEELGAGIASARPSKASTPDSLEARTARIRPSGSTAVTWATRSTRSLVRTPVPAPISRTSAALCGRSQSRASGDGPGRRRSYSPATAPKDPLKLAVVSSCRMDAKFSEGKQVASRRLIGAVDRSRKRAGEKLNRRSLSRVVNAIKWYPNAEVAQR